MNQIPNIEETHNTREVEEIAKQPWEHEMDLLWLDGAPTFKAQKNLIRFLIETHNHQLQKARQDWLREEIVKLEGMKRKICMHGPSDSCDMDCMHQHYDEEYNAALQTIIDRYQAELDQDVNK